MGASLVVIVFYISGHGFGHASREMAVINTILRRHPDVRIVVKTSVARWLFDASVRGTIEVQPLETDPGAVQIDSLSLDEAETAREAARFYRTFEQRTEVEAHALRALRATVVVGDIPPLAFAAADLAGLPSIAIANFTWDWIYGDYPDFERDAPGVIDTIAGAYAKATSAERLPMHGGFESMAHVVRDIPFIARQSRHGRDEARRRLGLGGPGPVVLASFGGYGLGLSYARIAQSDFTLVVTDHETSSHHEPVDRLKRLSVHTLAEHGLHYEDLVAASDVVVSKPGYGIVSECLANDTALLYTSRGHFAEYDVIVAALPRLLRCQFVRQDDLLAGRWCDAVHAVLEQAPPPDRPATNGADVVADEILRA